MRKDQVIATYKPSGIQTHQSSPEDPGFVEHLERSQKQKLYLFQRLDKGTSGLILIARSQETAQFWTELLKSKVLNKTYLFMTLKGKVSFNETTYSSTILKERGRWVSKPFNKNLTIHPHKVSTSDGGWDSENESHRESANEAELAPNSETHFKLLQESESHQLWQAQPRTGKAHQIRLHAQALGIPILGDQEHGGAPFFRLCLHAFKLENPESKETWSAPAPPFFEDLSLLTQPELCGLLDAFHQREQLKLQNLLEPETYRLSHVENPKLRIDRFGDQLWVYNYLQDHAESLIKEFLRRTQTQPLWIREMKNRGDQPNEAALIPLNNPSLRWRTQENDLTFELRADQGLSPGLFLDQRENRRWVRQNSTQKNVLNLFSYTCGFSLAAAVGGAHQVASVDVSQSFLDWGKTNFTLNGLDPEKYEFWSADSLDFLKRTNRMGRKFDLIICDPPSFGRSKRGVFRVEKDLALLMEMIFDLLNPEGQVLVSTNFEKWSQEEFELEALRKLSRNTYKKINKPLAGMDFLEPDLPILKTLILQKR